jgi:hypothetical protein
VQFWVNTPELPIDPESFSCEATPHPGSMPYHPTWQLKIDMHQPSRSDLRKLVELETQCAVLVTWVEVAVDVVPLRGVSVLELTSEIIGHSSLRGARESMAKDRSVYYSHPRGKNGLAIYNSRPSKLADWPEEHAARCFHMERRLQGKQALQRAGIITAKDLVDFDFRTFWVDVLHVFKYTDTALGNAIVSLGQGTAAKRRQRTPTGTFNANGEAKAWKKKYSKTGLFSVQSAWVDPLGKAVLEKLTPSNLWCLLAKQDARITTKLYRA